MPPHGCAGCQGGGGGPARGDRTRRAVSTVHPASPRASRWLGKWGEMIAPWH